MYSSHHQTTTFRLMVSTGGHILPRPHDKSLRYVGGETRMLTVDRHTTLSDLTTRLSKTVIRKSYTSSSTSSSVQFALKYQLPNEELDSLISVTTDEDIENMIDECERLSSGTFGTTGNSASASRIRLFIFPKPNPNNLNSDLGSDIGLFLNNPSKSEDWFLNTLNGTGSGFSDTSSVNCLLDLDDEIVLPEKKVNNSGQDVRSIPDSPMLETTSSFGSASSTPSQAPVSSATVVKEQSNPFFSFDEKTDQGLQMDYLKQHQQQSIGFDLSSVDLLLSDLTITDQSSPVSQIQSSNHNNRAADPSDAPNQNTQNPNSAYLTSMPTTQVESPRHQFHHQQPQYIPPPQYIHHQPPPIAVPVTSFYHHHHAPPNQHNFMYYIPTTQPPQCYNYPLQQPQPSQADTRSVAPTKTDLPVYRTNSGGPQLVRIPSMYQNQPQHVEYSGIHQPTQSMYYATPLATSQQVRTGQQP